MNHYKGLTEPHPPTKLYDKDSTWTDNEIYQIEPKHLLSYMLLQAYGDANTNLETMYPTFCSWGTLNAIKKEFPFFILRKV